MIGAIRAALGLDGPRDRRPAALAAAAALRSTVRRGPVDAQEVAEAHGVRVLYAAFADVDRGIAGFYDPRRVAIVVNRDIDVAAMQLTTARQLAHHLMHPDWSRGARYVVERRDRRPSTPEEAEADVFAGCLLVPMRTLRDLAPHATRSSLLRVFVVDRATLSRRMREMEGWYDPEILAGTD